MLVATLNVWARHGDWPSRRARLAAGFAALGPDLVALQETTVLGPVDQAAEIMGDAYHLAHSRRRSADGMGISIASRWPLLDVQELRLEGSEPDDGFPCTTLIATVDPPELDDVVRFVNYFPSWAPSQEFERERQAVRVAQQLASLTGHVVIAGDFDADPDAASMRYWTGHQSLDGTSVCYRDAWASCHPAAPGHTFVPDNPHSADWDWPYRRIDYLLVRCASHGGPTLQIAGCQRTFDQPDTVASDHYGLIADLIPPNTA